MIQITPQMRILVAIEPVDFRCGIDGLARVCRAILTSDPMDGTLFIFRSRAAKAIKLLVYDGQGFWCFSKRAQGLSDADTGVCPRCVRPCRAINQQSRRNSYRTPEG